MTLSEFTPEMLASAAGVLLSLLFSYLPGLSSWFQRLDGDHKRLVILGSLLAVSAGALGLSCLGVDGELTGAAILPACTRPGALALLRTLTLALVANQAVFLISPMNGKKTLDVGR